MHEYSLLLILAFYFNRALSILLVSAFTAIGGAAPLIGILYWHYAEKKKN